ncbi:VOC family protein [Bartonella choladocola]|uniref:Glyoxalase-like domain-containing protein n=1 Tax=Bartonella choladocola TaxID=2750995 RepID=A0A1U9MIZ9_9HYPH|nr:VOC family protein [Bartonella choladocola]AQT47690.1 Glyoxalase-like domain-containing protein [Bartonella choladocola]
MSQPMKTSKTDKNSKTAETLKAAETSRAATGLKAEKQSTPVNGSISDLNRHPVLGIDHVFILASELEKNADRFRRLGFTLSPRGVHSKEQGTANYTVMFAEDYFELLGIVEETPANRDKKYNLETYGEGLYAIAGRIANAVNAKKSLAELGFDVTDVQSFSRPLKLPDGKTGRAAFSTIAFEQNEVPNGQVFMCEQKTRDMVWRSELMTHKNSAIGLKSVTVLASEPEEIAQRYARLFRDGSVKKEAREFIVTTGKNSATIRVLTEETYKRLFPSFKVEKVARHAYAGLSIYVKDIGTAKHVLEENGITFQQENNKNIVIAPDHAAGTVLEFVEKDRAD